MPKSITGQAVFILVLTYKPDFNTGKSHPHRHHCLNFFVGLFIYFYSQICLLILCQSTTTLSLLFILSRDVLPTSGFSTPSAGCFQVHMKSSTISLPKERVSSITPQSKEWQNLKLFKVQRFISFFSGRTAAGTNTSRITSSKTGTISK